MQDERRRAGRADLGDRHGQAARLDLRVSMSRDSSQPPTNSAARRSPSGVGGVEGDQALASRQLVHRRGLAEALSRLSRLGDLEERLGAVACPSRACVWAPVPSSASPSARSASSTRLAERAGVEALGRDRLADQDRRALLANTCSQPSACAQRRSSPSGMCSRSSVGTQPREHRHVVGENADLADRRASRELVRPRRSKTSPSGVRTLGVEVVLAIGHAAGFRGLGLLLALLLGGLGLRRPPAPRPSCPWPPRAPGRSGPACRRRARGCRRARRRRSP